MRLQIKEFSVQEVNALLRAQRRVTIASRALTEFMVQGDVTDLNRLDELEYAAEEAAAAMRAILAKSIISVPRSWLIDDAPETVDWSKPDAMDYLRYSYVQKVLDVAMGDIAAVQDAEKN